MTSTTELLLYSAARNQVLNEKIIPELTKGNFVIADRYVDSTTAYQGFGRNLPMKLIQQLNQAATNNFLPSITIFLDLPVEKMVERQKTQTNSTDRLESAGLDFFKRVRRGYLDIAKNESNRVYIINANQKISVIENQIWELVGKKTDFSN
jgi:dTMP kinase